MKKIFSFIVLSILIISCANTKSLKNYDNNTVPDGLSLKQISSAIKYGAGGKGWVTKKGEGENELIADLTVRKHKVSVKIPYSTSEYSIKYLSSENMKYNKARNEIHRNYYRWIENLRIEINRELLRASTRE